MEGIQKTGIIIMSLDSFDNVLAITGALEGYINRILERYWGPRKTHNDDIHCGKNQNGISESQLGIFTLTAKFSNDLGPFRIKTQDPGGAYKPF